MVTPLSNFRSQQWSTNKPRETFDLGRSVGGQLNGGEIILPNGPLGAGKTGFVKGMASALGIADDEVNSPTFTLVNRYNGRLTVYHVDLYRLDNGPSAAHAVDLDELIADEHAVVVIEWGERLGTYPMPPALRITIEGDGDETRMVSIDTE